MQMGLIVKRGCLNNHVVIITVALDDTDVFAFHFVNGLVVILSRIIGFGHPAATSL